MAPTPRRRAPWPATAPCAPCRSSCAAFSIRRQRGGTLTSLAEVGIAFQKDGSLLLDSSKLDSAIAADFSDVTNLFSSSTGYATRLEAWAKSALAAGGLIDTRTQSLNKNVKNYNEEIDRLENRMSALEKKYIKEYTNLNLLLSSMNSTSTYLTQQLNSSRQQINQEKDVYTNSRNAAHAYANVGLETGVVAASPQRLIIMLYEGAELAVRMAIRHMKEGDIAKKSAAITKATTIILEGLRAALDPPGRRDRAAAGCAVRLHDQAPDARPRQERDRAAGGSAGPAAELHGAWQAIDAVGRAAPANASLHPLAA